MHIHVRPIDRCPECNSGDIYVIGDFDDRNCMLKFDCGDCGTQWTAVYTPIGVTNIEDENGVRLK